MQYFIQRNGKVNGPFTASQIKSGAKSGKLKDTDLISDSKDGPWKKLEKLTEALGARDERASTNKDKPDEENVMSWIEGESAQPELGSSGPFSDRSQASIQSDLQHVDEESIKAAVLREMEDFKDMLFPPVQSGMTAPSGSGIPVPLRDELGGQDWKAELAALMKLANETTEKTNRAELEKLRQALEQKEEEYKSLAPSELDYVSLGNHQCPHCGSKVNVGYSACSQCNRNDIIWITQPLLFAGHVFDEQPKWGDEWVGPCIAGTEAVHQAYFLLKAHRHVTWRKWRIKKGACFVATVVFKEEQHVTVIGLRLFRDRVLAESTYGQCFIDWYYKNGPQLAEFIQRMPWANRPIRMALAGILKVLQSCFPKIRP